MAELNAEDLSEMTDEKLEAEAHRIGELMDQCRESLALIRDERSRRLDAEVKRLRAKLGERSGQ